jgi:hypothetical protein
MSPSTKVSSKRHLAAALLDQQRGEMEEKLSRPNTKAGRLQRACLALYHEHLRDGALPTSGRFLFYEREDRGIVPKAYHRADGTRRPGGVMDIWAQYVYTIRAISRPARVRRLDSDSAWGIIVFGGGGGRGCAGRGCLFWIVISIVLSVALTVLANLILLLFSGGGPPGGVGV